MTIAGDGSDYYGFERFAPEQVWSWLDDKLRRVTRPDHEIMIHRKRLGVFRHKGTRCIACKRKATFFRSDVHMTDKSLIDWYFHPLEYPVPLTHLNLYGMTKRGNLFMMTVDHLVPLSLGIAAGGTNKMENLAPMCTYCNAMKGNDPTWHIDLPRNKHGDLIKRPHRQVKPDPSVKKAKRIPWYV